MNLTDIKKYGFQKEQYPEINPDTPLANGADNTVVARVLAVHRERYALICEAGECYGRLKAKEYYKGYEDFPTTGDFVLISYNPQGESQIVKTLPRRTYFSRRDPTPGRGEQAVASNFDYVFLMQSLNHDFNERRLERYLTLAWQSGAIPVVVLTKADLVDNPDEYMARISDIAVGADIFAVSSATGEGLSDLEKYLQPGKTLVFLGSSGVGKSSLVNALAGEEIMTVNGIREDDSKGRHTTTHRQLIMLRSGAMIIDTPGMRELGMWDVSSGLSGAFSDVESFLGKCKYRDCKHESEPGCAIRAAIDTGELSPDRWESYKKLRDEAEYADDKESFMKKKNEWSKGVAKFSKERKKLERYR